jgi:hypothetical protein
VSVPDNVRAFPPTSAGRSQWMARCWVGWCSDDRHQVAGYAGLSAKVTLKPVLRVQNLWPGAHLLDNITILTNVYIKILIADYPRVLQIRSDRIDTPRGADPQIIADPFDLIGALHRNYKFGPTLGKCRWGLLQYYLYKQSVRMACLEKLL